MSDPPDRDPQGDERRDWRGRAAFALAVGVAVTILVFAVAAVWAEVHGNTPIGEAASRFLTGATGAIIGALAAYIGTRGGRNGDE